MKFHVPCSPPPEVRLKEVMVKLDWEDGSVVLNGKEELDREVELEGIVMLR